MSFNEVPIMAAHSPEAVTLANTTLLIHVIKMLGHKGLLTDAEWSSILSGAVTELSRHSDGLPAIDVIKEITKVDFKMV